MNDELKPLTNNAESLKGFPQPKRKYWHKPEPEPEEDKLSIREHFLETHRYPVGKLP